MKIGSIFLAVFLTGCAQWQALKDAAPGAADKALAANITYLCKGARRGALERWLGNDQGKRVALEVVCR